MRTCISGIAFIIKIILLSISVCDLRPLLTGIVTASITVVAAVAARVVVPAIGAPDVGTSLVVVLTLVVLIEER